jgi:spheroidene monooxygenase
MSKNSEEDRAPQAVTHTDVASSRNVQVFNGTVLILLAKIRPRYWSWGWNRIAFGSWFTDPAPGLRFIKTLGSGVDGGFGLTPSPSHQGMFCVFDSVDEANQFVEQAPLIAAYRQRSDELFMATLRPSSVRGSWDGVSLTAGDAIAPDAMMATLTRASIRPASATAFWRYAPDAQKDLMTAAGCDLAIGLGEAPVFRQATFSLWKNTAAMDAYARAGAHMEAIRAAWKHEFFSESMFVRFAPIRMQGQWKGKHFG